MCRALHTAHSIVLPSLTVCALNSLYRQLRSALAGRDVPEDIKAQIMKLHEDNMNAREQLKVMTEKFNKAKAVRLAVFFQCCIRRN